MWVGGGEQQSIPGGRNGISKALGSLLAGCVGGQAELLEQTASLGILERSSVLKAYGEMSVKDSEY